MIHHCRYVFLALVGAAYLVAAGCNSSPPLPKTYPASGTVVYKGGRAMKGGSINFESASDPLLRVIGDIEENGTFKLRTVKDNAKADGAPEGEYQVSVQPPAVQDSRGGVQGAHKGVPAIALTKKYKVEAKENSFNIELPDAPPK